MKKYIVISLAGVAALLSSCVVDPYGPGYGPGYAYGPYGEPYFVYGGINYYSYGGRYYYVEHGHRVYVHQLPSGGHYYHGHNNNANVQKYPHNSGYNTYNKTNYSNTNKVNYSNTNPNLKGQQYSQGQKTTAAKYQAPVKGSKDKDKYKDNH